MPNSRWCRFCLLEQTPDFPHSHFCNSVGNCVETPICTPFSNSLNPCLPFPVGSYSLSYKCSWGSFPIAEIILMSYIKTLHFPYNLCCNNLVRPSGCYCWEAAGGGGVGKGLSLTTHIVEMVMHVGGSVQTVGALPRL